MTNASEMTVEQLLIEWNKASAAFGNRGDHGGSPGEGHWERMQEIETELHRRGVKTRCVMQQVFPFNTGHTDIDLLEIPPYMSEAEAGKLFRQGEVAAEEAYGPLPDEQVLKTTLAECPHPEDTRERHWWWLGYTRYMHRHRAADLKKSLEDEHQRLTQEYQASVDKQDRINELDLVNKGLGRALDHLKVVASLRAENDRLTQWVADLQAGMSVNCVYCGYNYGPKKDTPASMADILRAHVEKCPKHPLSQALARIAQLEGEARLDNEDRCRLHEHIQRQQVRIAELETQVAGKSTPPPPDLSEYLFNICPNAELEYMDEGDREDQPTHFLILVKKSYWTEHHHIDDRHLTAADPVLHEAMRGLGLGECMDSTFDLYGDAQVAELPAKLQVLGMSTDPELDDFMRTHHP